MHRKRSTIRVLARLMYVSGFIFLISGLLLSAVNNPALAAGQEPIPENLTDQALQETPDPECPCDTPTGTVPISDNGDGEDSSSSSLVFSSGCHCSCENVYATVCNVGDADMVEQVEWKLYFSADGNPSFGQVVNNGNLGPLGAGQCVDLNYPPTNSGSFAYRVNQEASGAGPSVVWSNSCMVSGDCFAATATSTPFLPDTATPTGEVTEQPTDEPTVEATVTSTGIAPPDKITLTPTAPAGPTSTATRQSTPMPFNLSFVCGYAGDDYLLWWVANNTSDDADYVWRVSGTDEEGSGSVEANSVGYFTTSTGDKTVRLFIDDELVDSGISSEPCKEYLTLSYTCSEDGLIWYARNPNDFGVDYTWTLDGEPGGRGMLPANTSVQLITTTVDDHTLELVWTDTRPGSHTVRLTSTEDACDFPETATPTSTSTAPPVVITLTPTPTNTETAPPVVITNTPTSTPVVITNTPTPTNTLTSTPVVITNTPTPTNTPQTPVFITATNSPTVPFIVITNTPTITPRPPIVIIITATDVPTVNVVTLTPTNTALPPVFITATSEPQPPFIVITNTPTATSTALPPVFVTPTLITPVPVQIVTSTATQLIPETGQFITFTPTQILTLAPPVVTITRTPVLIPVTGGDSTDYGTAMRLSLLGGLLTNAGLVTLGLALALTGIQAQLKQK